MKAAVVGAGTMGNGIAHVFAQSGWDVSLIDVSSVQLDAALQTIRKNLDRQVKKGSVSQGDSDATIARIRPVSELKAAAAAEIVIEAVSESPAVKFKIFQELDQVAKPDAILASN